MGQISHVSRRKERRRVSWKIGRSLKKLNAGSPTDARDSMLNLRQNVRRIVAQVGAKLLKNRAFLAVRDSVPRCDDLLTTTVDNDDRARLINRPTERGGFLGPWQRQVFVP